MESLSRGTKRKQPAALSPSPSWRMQEPSESAPHTGVYEDLDPESRAEHPLEMPSKRQAFDNGIGTGSHNSSHSTTCILTPAPNQYISEPEIFKVSNEEIDDLSRAINKALEECAAEELEADEMHTAATLDIDTAAPCLPGVPYQELSPGYFAKDLAAYYADDNATHDFFLGSHSFTASSIQSEHHQSEIPRAGLVQGNAEGMVGQAPAIPGNTASYSWQTPMVGHNTSNGSQGVPLQTAHSQGVHTMVGKESRPKEYLPAVMSDLAPPPSTANNQGDDKWQYEAGVAMTLMNKKDAEPFWEAKKILQGYPDPRDSAQNPPAGLTGEQFCKQYPNHLEHHYLGHFIQKKYSGNMMGDWVNADVKGKWAQLGICKDPKNMLGKRLVNHRARLGPDGMIWLDNAPNFLGSAPIDTSAKLQKETAGEGKGRDPTRWLSDRAKEREERPMLNEKAKIKRAEVKARKEAQAATLNQE